MPSGIYQIRNTINGKFYVGSAKDFEIRWCKHISALSLEKHHSRHLQAAWNKYGSEAFVFEVLTECVTQDLIKTEQFYIDLLEPQYNICPTAGSSLGVKYTEQAKANISASLRGRKLSPEHRAKVVAVLERHRDHPAVIANQQLRGPIIGKLPQSRKSASERAKAKCADPVWFADFVERSAAARRGKPANISREKVEARTAAVIQYNKTREITDEMRSNMGVGQRNKCSAERITYNGEEKTVLAWADAYGLDRHVLRKRINAGWDIHDALTRPAKKKPRRSA